MINEKLLNALKVIIKDPRISAWLEENDPMALRQANEALDAASPEVQRERTIREYETQQRAEALAYLARR